ncbi:MAG: hypothetical protein HGA86_08410, partial [Anaerolineaceae bacterium]|nr:hypothetical protein [Anaerolineaceae bacterium]
VKNVHHVRTHFSGPILMVDVHILVNNRMSIEKVHALTNKVEAAVRVIAPGADVIVHPEPVSNGVTD